MHHRRIFKYAPHQYSIDGQVWDGHLYLKNIAIQSNSIVCENLTTTLDNPYILQKMGTEYNPLVRLKVLEAINGGAATKESICNLLTTCLDLKQFQKIITLGISACYKKSHDFQLEQCIYDEIIAQKKHIFQETEMIQQK